MAHSLNVSGQRMTGGKSSRLKTASTRPVMVWQSDRSAPERGWGSHFRQSIRLACFQGNTPPSEQLPSHSLLIHSRLQVANLAIQLTHRWCYSWLALVTESRKEVGALSWLQRQQHDTGCYLWELAEPVAQALSYGASMMQGRQLLTAHAPVIRHFVVAPSLTLATVSHIRANSLKHRDFQTLAVGIMSHYFIPRMSSQPLSMNSKLNYAGRSRVSSLVSHS